MSVKFIVVKSGWNGTKNPVDISVICDSILLRTEY